MKPMLVEPYWCKEHIDIYFHDFNKEICAPGFSELYLMGAVGIRVDNDFDVVAVLPFTYCTMPIEEIVALFWPGIKDATFNPISIYGVSHA